MGKNTIKLKREFFIINSYARMKRIRSERARVQRIIAARCRGKNIRETMATGTHFYLHLFFIIRSTEDKNLRDARDAHTIHIILIFRCVRPIAQRRRHIIIRHSDSFNEYILLRTPYIAKVQSNLNGMCARRCDVVLRVREFVCRTDTYSTNVRKKKSN